eukprot:5466086-Ditylum_brightwellii.AAC.1
MKAYTADLDTFNIVPESNWRGTGSRIFISRSGGSPSLQYLIGNPSEIQALTFRDPLAFIGNVFTLTFGEFTTENIDWPVDDGDVAARDIQDALMPLHSVKGNVQVVVSSYTKFEYVFLITFWGSFSMEGIPEITSTIYQTGAVAKIYHETIRDGIANGYYSSLYTALQEANDDGSKGKYMVRVTARNKKGYGTPSELNMASTAPIGKLPGPPRSVMLGRYYSSSDLHLDYRPPQNDGGAKITKYRIEWDSSPSFIASNIKYGSDEIAIQHEEQEIVLSCHSPCYGIFILSWGGMVSDRLSVGITADEMEVEIAKLVGVYDIGAVPVKVTKKAYGFGSKWLLTFFNVYGNIGEVEANGHFLYGGDPVIRVDEIIAGNADIYPGDYTYEVQTVYIRKAPGFDSPVTGSFTLAFEDEITPTIGVDASADDMKRALEILTTIHTVNVQHHMRSDQIAWVITFTHLVHENRQGAGDIGLIRVFSSSLFEPSVTRIGVFENVKGTQPMTYKINGLSQGIAYYCRVSAYNALGYGLFSATSAATPRGKSLKVVWTPVENDGGSAIAGYELEWYSKESILEVQKITTSSTDGISEVQIVRTSAEKQGITGFFTLTFNGETTEPIDHDAPADGMNSVESKLKRLSTIGD